MRTRPTRSATVSTASVPIVMRSSGRHAVDPGLLAAPTVGVASPARERGGATRAVAIAVEVAVGAAGDSRNGFVNAAWQASHSSYEHCEQWKATPILSSPHTSHVGMIAARGGGGGGGVRASVCVCGGLHKINRVAAPRPPKNNLLVVYVL